jgi:hypothetical protein
MPSFFENGFPDLDQNQIRYIFQNSKFETTCLLLFENGFPDLDQNQIQNISYNSKSETTCLLLFLKMDF